MDHKLAQLRAQVEEAVSYALGASRDPVLRDLLVVSVTSVRGAALLDIKVTTLENSPILEAAPILEKLNRAKGYLRSEIASGINRKRCPDICFSVASGGWPVARG